MYKEEAKIYHYQRIISTLLAYIFLAYTVMLIDGYTKVLPLVERIYFKEHIFNQFNIHKTPDTTQQTPQSHQLIQYLAYNQTHQ